MTYTARDLAEMFHVSQGAVWYWKSAGIIEPIGRRGKKTLLFSEQAIPRILSYNRRKKRMKIRAENGNAKGISLCWQCIHTYGAACSWAAAKIPVKGWKAKEIRLKAYSMPSYRVEKCPNFEKELFYTAKDGTRQRLNKVAGGVREADILDFYRRAKG